MSYSPDVSDYSVNQPVALGGERDPARYFDEARVAVCIEASGQIADEAATRV